MPSSFRSKKAQLKIILSWNKTTPEFERSLLAPRHFSYPSASACARGRTGWDYSSEEDLEEEDKSSEHLEGWSVASSWNTADPAFEEFVSTAYSSNPSPHPYLPDLTFRQRRNSAAGLAGWKIPFASSEKKEVQEEEELVGGSSSEDEEDSTSTDSDSDSDSEAGSTISSIFDSPPSSPTQSNFSSPDSIDWSEELDTPDSYFDTLPFTVVEPSLPSRLDWSEELETPDTFFDTLPFDEFTPSLPTPTPVASTPRIATAFVSIVERTTSFDSSSSAAISPDEHDDAFFSVLPTWASDNVTTVPEEDSYDSRFIHLPSLRKPLATRPKGDREGPEYIWRQALVTNAFLMGLPKYYTREGRAMWC